MPTFDEVVLAHPNLTDYWTLEETSGTAFVNAKRSTSAFLSGGLILGTDYSMGQASIIPSLPGAKAFRNLTGKTWFNAGVLGAYDEEGVQPFTYFFVFQPSGTSAGFTRIIRNEEDAGSPAGPGQTIGWNVLRLPDTAGSPAGADAQKVQFERHSGATFSNVAMSSGALAAGTAYLFVLRYGGTGTGAMTIGVYNTTTGALTGSTTSTGSLPAVADSQLKISGTGDWARPGRIGVSVTDQFITDLVASFRAQTVTTEPTPGTPTNLVLSEAIENQLVTLTITADVDVNTTTAGFTYSINGVAGQPLPDPTKTPTGKVSWVIRGLRQGDRVLGQIEAKRTSAAGTLLTSEPDLLVDRTVTTNPTPVATIVNNLVASVAGQTATLTWSLDGGAATYEKIGIRDPNGVLTETTLFGAPPVEPPPAVPPDMAALSAQLDTLFPAGWQTSVLPSNTLVHANSANGVYELKREIGGKGTATVTAGSSILTNVVTTSNEFVVGQRIFGTGIPANVRISAIDTAARTITYAGAGASSSGANRGIQAHAPWIETTQFTADIIVVPLTTPYVPVDHYGQFLGQSWAANFATMIGNGIPIPAGYAPTPDSDATAVFIQPDWVSADGTLHGRMYELWAVRTPAQTGTGRYACKWGIRMTGTRERTNGGIPIDRGGALTVEGTYEDSNWGVQATKIPFVDNIIRVDDIARRQIRHPLGFKTDFVNTSGPYPYVFPAQGSDSGARTDLPQGARFRLPAGYFIDPSWDWRKRMMVEQMRDYGWVFTDTSAFNFGIRAEYGVGNVFDTYPGGKEGLIRDLPFKDMVRIADSSASNQNPVSVPVTNTVAPTLRGVGSVGFALTIETGVWAGNPPPTYTYKIQWLNGATWTDLATAQTYTPVAGDVGRQIRGLVTAAKDPAQGTGADPAPVATSNTVTVAAATSFVVIEQGEGTNGTALTSRAADKGGSWTYHAVGGSSPLILANGWIRQSAISGFTIALIGSTVTGQNGEVRGRLKMPTNAGGSAGIGWFDPSVATGYLFRFSAGSPSNWGIARFNTGTAVTIGTNVNATLTPGQIYDIRAVAAGGVLSLYLDGSGTPTVTATDPSPLANLGTRAMRWSAQTAVGDNVGLQLTDFRA